MRNIVIAVALLLLFGCSKSESPTVPTVKPSNTTLVDKSADAGTVALFNKLLAIKSKGVMVGHHESTAYGVGWVANVVEETSDVKKVAGDMPAVFGWDVSGIDNNASTVIDGVAVTEVAEHVKWADANGGINTFCWHAYNPIDGADSWQVNSTTVPRILPGGPYYKEFRTRVARVAQFLKSLKDKNGNPIPIIFRPWHEHTGNWFWWGTTGCTASEYKKLWQTTVKLLRDTLNVHNLIYAYSPSAVNNESEYLERYPGDEFVDILGFDEYWWSDQYYLSNMTRNVGIIKSLAAAKSKLYAVTETGYEGIKQSDWFTKQVYPYLQNSGISYVLFWRNANTTHHYVPYLGHPAAADFKAFTDKSDILLLSDISK